MKTMKNIDSFTHVRGESLFVEDLILRQDALFGLCFDAPRAHGKIIAVDYTKAVALEGVVKIFTYKDILGENQIGGIIPDEDKIALNELGAGELFPPGTNTGSIVEYIVNWVKEHRDF